MKKLQILTKQLLKTVIKLKMLQKKQKKMMKRDLKQLKKDDKIEQKGTENDGNKGPKPAEKLKKDEKYLESLREKAKG